MSVESAQDAIVAQLLANAAIAAEFKTNISKGMGRNFNFSGSAKGIRVYQISESFFQNQLPNTQQLATYPFLLIALFYEPDEALGETRKTQYSAMIRTAIEVDPTFGATCYDSVLGETKFYFHPQLEGAYYLAISLIVKRQEIVG